MSAEVRNLRWPDIKNFMEEDAQSCDPCNVADESTETQTPTTKSKQTRTVRKTKIQLDFKNFIREYGIVSSLVSVDKYNK